MLLFMIIKGRFASLIVDFEDHGLQTSPSVPNYFEHVDVLLNLQ